jgi:hypothetical protein
MDDRFARMSLPARQRRRRPRGRAVHAPEAPRDRPPALGRLEHVHAPVHVRHHAAGVARGPARPHVQQEDRRGRERRRLPRQSSAALVRGTRGGRTICTGTSPRLRRWCASMSRAHARAALVHAASDESAAGPARPRCGTNGRWTMICSWWYADQSAADWCRKTRSARSGSQRTARGGERGRRGSEDGTHGVRGPSRPMR